MTVPSTEAALLALADKFDPPDELPETDWQAFAQDVVNGDTEALRARLPEYLRPDAEPWWVVRYKDDEHESVQAESPVMARFAVETREGGTGHDCGHPDHIARIEGPFAARPEPTTW